MVDASRISELLGETEFVNGRMLYYRGAPVAKSSELDRIKALPRRVLDLKDPSAAQLWTMLLRRKNPVCTCDGKNCAAKKCHCWRTYRGQSCITHLRNVQGWTLAEAAAYGSFVGSIGVGEGKTGIDILAPMVIPGVRNAGVLIPVALRPQFLENWAQWSEHFETPNLVGGADFKKDSRPRTHVITYSMLSQKDNTDMLTRLGLDFILADEAQALKDPKAARTARFLRDFTRHDPKTGERLPRPKYSAHSGTFTTTSPQDYAHHMALALGEGSPLPLEKPVLDEFSSALAELPQGNSRPGELLTLGTPEEVQRLRSEGNDDTTIARLFFAKRFRETPGVVVTVDGRPRHPETQEEIKLKIAERPVTLPREKLDGKQLIEPLRGLTLMDVRKHVVNTWERPDGEELVEVLDYYRCLKELSSGFFYRWRFPRCEPEEVIERWFQARKEWRRDVRDFLKAPGPFADSPAWAEEAAKRWHFGYEFEGQRIEAYRQKGPMPVLKSASYLFWKSVENTVEPVSSVVWLSSFLVDDAIAWLRDHPREGIVWYEHTAFGEELQRKARQEGLEVGFFPGGDEANEQIKLETGNRSIIASIEAHHFGKNLQSFRHGLIANVPASGARWEQLLGRWHRNGQTATTVHAYMYRHTQEYKDAIDTAIGKARYIQQMMGSEQRLCYADLNLIA